MNFRVEKESFYGFCVLPLLSLVFELGYLANSPDYFWHSLAKLPKFMAFGSSFGEILISSG
jgi:hypothetical protein